ncbi:MAG TPA: hypothetical protein PKC18_06430, partial [Lacipirellulaceae bacterium]|nr:hypothetical protein [Lacipirellulaceae bacterium]
MAPAPARRRQGRITRFAGKIGKKLPFGAFGRRNLLADLHASPLRGAAAPAPLASRSAGADELSKPTRATAIRPTSIDLAQEGEHVQ